MPVTVIIHIANEEPILGELEEVPAITDNLLVVQNVRRKDGKDVSYLADDVTTVIWPWSRINFVEIMPSEEEDQIIGFVRE